MGTSSNFGNMLSMAGAALVLPFLPMTPGQILLNNLIYDASQTALPTDTVDPEVEALPARWDIRGVERFMVVFGPISSLFDFLTFGLLLLVLGQDERAFHTGWFIESLFTQILVVLVIRTRRSPFWHSRPSRELVVAIIAALAAAVPGWNRRHPDVDRFARHPQRNPPILRQALLGDVELRHDLDARDDRAVQRARRLDQVAQRAVDAQPHHRARLERLDVDVGGAVAQRLREQGVDQSDQRRVVLALEQILDPGDVLQQPGQIEVLREVIGKGGRAGVGGVVEGRNQLVELIGADAPRVQGHAERAAHFGECARVRAAAHRHLRQAIAQSGDQNAFGLGKGVGDNRFDHFDAAGLSAPAGGALWRGGRLGDPKSGRTLGMGLALSCSPRM